MCVILLDYLEARQNLWNGISCKWHSCHWQDNVGSQARFTFIRHHLVPFKGQRQMCRQCSLEQGVSYFEQKHLSWEGKAAKLSRHQNSCPCPANQLIVPSQQSGQVGPWPQAIAAASHAVPQNQATLLHATKHTPVLVPGSGLFCADSAWPAVRN